MGFQKEDEATKSHFEPLNYIQILVTENMKPRESSIQFKTPPIYKVPERFRMLKKSAYTPRVVAIGPIHSNVEHVQSMKYVKVNFMTYLFKRTREDGKVKSKAEVDEVIGECWDAMLSMAKKAKDCYAESVTNIYSEGEFAQMMIVDGSFILEVMFANTRGEDHDLQMLGDIKYDMLLLENQIPFFVLYTLYDILIQPLMIQPMSFNKFVLIFFTQPYDNSLQYPPIPLHLITEEDDAHTNVRPDYGHDHILGLIHRCYKVNRDDLVRSQHVTMKKYTATELKASGVKLMSRDENISLLVKFETTCLLSWFPHFRRKTTNRDPFTSTSSKKCCFLFRLCEIFGSASLEIPKLPLNGLTESFLRNLIAYEQCSSFFSDVTAYAFLMDTLIDSKEDVEILEGCGVLDCQLGTNEDASILFNSICTEALRGDVYFSEEWKNLDTYCKRCWTKNLSSLRTNYFNSPWTIISVVAALILFVLTFIQTIYSVD